MVPLGGGPSKLSFLASNIPTVLWAGGQASLSPMAGSGLDGSGEGVGGHTFLLGFSRYPIPASHVPRSQTHQPYPFLFSEPAPHTLPSSGNPIPGAPLMALMTQCETGHFPEQGPKCPHQPGSCSREHSA